MAYIIFLLVIILEYYLFLKGEKNKVFKNAKKKFLIFAFFEIVLFSGFRDFSVGADTINYLNGLSYYRAMEKNDILGASLYWKFKYEPGYFLMLKIFAFVGVTDRIFLILISVIIYLPIFIFVYKYSENCLISLISFFCFGFFSYSVSLFRQMIALSIATFGFKYILNKKFIKFLLIILLAMTFHSTAFILLPLYFFYKIKTRDIIVASFVIQPILLLFGRKIMIAIFGLTERYSNYLNSQYDGQGIGFYLILLDSILLICYFLLENVDLTNNKVIKLSIIGFSMACALQSLGYSMELFGRIVPYYSLILIVLIPGIYNYLVEKYSVNKYVGYFSIIMFLSIVGYYIISHDIYTSNYVFAWS